MKKQDLRTKEHRNTGVMVLGHLQDTLSHEVELTKRMVACMANLIWALLDTPSPLARAATGSVVCRYFLGAARQ